MSIYIRHILNKINIFLLLTILLALCLRFVMFKIYAYEDHFLVLKLSYASFAYSINKGEGYRDCVSKEGYTYQQNAKNLIPFE